MHDVIELSRDELASVAGGGIGGSVATALSPLVSPDRQTLNSPSDTLRDRPARDSQPY